jgi:hypothetical protein
MTNNGKIILSLHIKIDNTKYEIRNLNRLRAHKTFINWIDSLCISNGITYYRITKDCILPTNYLYNVKHGYYQYSISLDVIMLISKQYNYPFLLSDYLA